jgi:dTDP-4-amino-4,6-dideoxygalactose transaminase
VIPFLDLKAQYRGIQGEVASAVFAVLESGQYVLGEAVAKFEEQFAGYCGVRHAVAVNSGTSALHLALLAAGVGSGDEVITTPFTFVATVAAICQAGAQPVFVDIDPQTYTLNVDQISRRITKRTKAILPVHLYGQPADMDPVREIARTRELRVIEDAAQAHGAAYNGRPVGSLGDLACFSFYPGKNLGACGEGGIVVTNDPAHDRVLRILRDWGQERKYHHVLRGFNYRMDAIQAAILSVKLRSLESWTHARQERASWYGRWLRDSDVLTPIAMTYARHVYHIYAIRTSQRELLQTALRDDGIHTGIHYPVPVHLQPAYADLRYRSGMFPHAEQAANEVLSLPMYPELTADNVRAVCDSVCRNSATIQQGKRRCA